MELSNENPIFIKWWAEVDCLDTPRVERAYGFSFQKLCFFQRKDLRTPLGLRSNQTKLCLVGSHPHFPLKTKTVIPKGTTVLIKIGQRWIRTTVVSRRQIYSLFPLATRASTHIKFSKNLPLTRFELVTSPLPRECSAPEPQGHRLL